MFERLKKLFSGKKSTNDKSNSFEEIYSAWLQKAEKRRSSIERHEMSLVEALIEYSYEDKPEEADTSYRNEAFPNRGSRTHHLGMNPLAVRPTVTMPSHVSESVRSSFGSEISENDSIPQKSNRSRAGSQFAAGGSTFFREPKATSSENHNYSPLPLFPFNKSNDK